MAAVKAQIAELENRLKLAMGDAETAISPHDTDALHWRNVRATRLDTTKLKGALPAIYDEFAVTTTTRRFTLL
jgi:predicted phage-related endonuclease